MVSADERYWITFNGEIYNFQELARGVGCRRLCISHAEPTPRSSSPPMRRTELRALRKLRGMFAFAIWDTESRTLFLARDRVGKKPLHFFLDRDGLVVRV